jgi:hypothetical protein
MKALASGEAFFRIPPPLVPADLVDKVQRLRWTGSHPTTRWLKEVVRSDVLGSLQKATEPTLPSQLPSSKHGNNSCGYDLRGGAIMMVDTKI